MSSSPKTSGPVPLQPLCPQPHSHMEALPWVGRRARAPSVRSQAPLWARGLRPRWFRPDHDVSPGCKHLLVPSQLTCAHTRTHAHRYAQAHACPPTYHRCVFCTGVSDARQPVQPPSVDCSCWRHGGGGWRGRDRWTRVVGGLLEEPRKKCKANAPMAGSWRWVPLGPATNCL